MRCTEPQQCRCESHERSGSTHIVAVLEYRRTKSRSGFLTTSCWAERANLSLDNRTMFMKNICANHSRLFTPQHHRLPSYRCVLEKTLRGDIWCFSILKLNPHPVFYMVHGINGNAYTAQRAYPSIYYSAFWAACDTTRGDIHLRIE